MNYQWSQPPATAAVPLILSIRAESTGAVCGRLLAMFATQTASIYITGREGSWSDVGVPLAGGDIHAASNSVLLLAVRER